MKRDSRQPLVKKRVAAYSAYIFGVTVPATHETDEVPDQRANRRMFDLVDETAPFQKRVPALAQILDEAGSFGDLLYVMAEDTAPVPRPFLK
jgi:hypothetical protein